MSRKELLDVIFRLSLVLVLIAALFVYYETSQANRYRYVNEDSGHGVFDSRTGKFYFRLIDKGSTVWVVFSLLETPLGKRTDLVRPLHPVQKSPTPLDYSKMSDEELARIAGIKLEKPPAKAKPQPPK